MNRPNLFQIASSELSQDAFFAWLIQWANSANMQDDSALCASGQDFIRFILNKGGKSNGISKIDKVIVRKQVTVQDKPRKRKGIIDLWVEINDRFLIVVEDKTGSAEHSAQLDRYREVAEKYCAEKNMQLALIYLKTQDETKSKINVVTEKGFCFIGRKDLLDFFSTHSVRYL